MGGTACGPLTVDSGGEKLPSLGGNPVPRFVAAICWLTPQIPVTYQPLENSIWRRILLNVATVGSPYNAIPPKFAIVHQHGLQDELSGSKCHYVHLGSQGECRGMIQVLVRKTIIRGVAYGVVPQRICGVRVCRLANCVAE